MNDIMQRGGMGVSLFETRGTRDTSLTEGGQKKPKFGWYQLQMIPLRHSLKMAYYN